MILSRALSFVALAVVANVASAACPGLCSGNGYCGPDEVCTCFPGWGMDGEFPYSSRAWSFLCLLTITNSLLPLLPPLTTGQAGGDCSSRFCPYELAWVDSPDANGRHHKYVECAGKGTCNRSTGECGCFPGYEGKACARQSCPNECSGHGTCEFMKDLTYGIVYNEYHDGTSLELSGLGSGAKKFDSASFDMDRARACVCDPGWTGITCADRMCPYGNDILDVIPGYDETSTLGLPGHGNEVPQTQTITLYDANDVNANFDGQSFAIRFTSKLNETFVTKPIAWSTDDTTLAEYIEDALLSLPNRVIDEVGVSVDSAIDANGVVIDISFIGVTNQGKQHKLEVLVDKCEDGCTPRRTGLLNLRTFSDTTLSTVEISTVGSHQSYECGRRGKCDRGNGLCRCFPGFTGKGVLVFFSFLSSRTFPSPPPSLTTPHPPSTPIHPGDHCQMLTTLVSQPLL